MKNNISKKIFRCSAVLALVSLAWIGPVSGKDSRASVEINVSSSANTGGNFGENVETGSASARSSVKTETNGSSGETNIKIEAQAEANGKKVEVTEESSDSEAISIQKKIKEDGAEASVDIEIGNPDKEESRAGIFSEISQTIGSIVDKLLSIFS